MKSSKESCCIGMFVKSCLFLSVQDAFLRSGLSWAVMGLLGQAWGVEGHNWLCRVTDRGYYWTKAADASKAGSQEGEPAQERTRTAVLCWPFTVLSTLHGNPSSLRGRRGLQMSKQKSTLLSANVWRTKVCAQDWLQG